MPLNKNYYELLDVSQTASTDELKKAFRKRAMETHPDRNPGNPEAANQFRDITEAYDVLSDSKKRANYDRQGAAYRTEYTTPPPAWDELDEFLAARDGI